MTILQRIENILQVSQAARNSDKELWLIYAQKSGMNLTPEQIKTYKDMPSSETIRRTRQQLQMQGKYPASKRVEQYRFNKFRQVRQNINMEPVERIFGSYERKDLY